MRKCVNALNGLPSFLLQSDAMQLDIIQMMCQRPERASFISTSSQRESGRLHKKCQRPERASFISTKIQGK